MDSSGWRCATPSCTATRRSLFGGDGAAAYDRLRAGLPPIVQGDGSRVQDLAYAGDVARANLLAMESSISGEALNDVSGADASTNRVVEILAETLGSDLTPERIIDPDKLELPHAPSIRFTGDKARRLIGFEAEVSAEDGLRRVVEWLDAETVRSGH